MLNMVTQQRNQPSESLTLNQNDLNFNLDEERLLA